MSIAALGGVLADAAGVPLPYMLGAIVTTMLAAFIGLPIAQPTRLLVVPMRVILGILLGTAVTPALMDNVKPLIGALIFVPIYVAITSIFGTYYYRRFAGLTSMEAFFAGLPGGIFTMTAYAEDAGIDTRRLAVCHAVRISAVVLVIPSVLALVEVKSGIAMQLTAPLADVSLRNGLLLAAVGATGAVLGHFSRLPGGLILGALLGSATLTLTEVTTISPPVEVVVVAQLVLGAAIGSKFIGYPFSEVRRLAGITLGYVFVSMTLTFFVALFLAVFFATPMGSGLLAFAPGGLAEMSLVALGLNLNVGFVTAIQVARIIVILMISPFIFQIMRYRGLLGE